MFINISEYKQIIKERRELLENQCNSATSHEEYKHYIANYKVCHFELLNSVKKSIRNIKFTCVVATVGIWISLIGCAFCGVFTHTVSCLMWLPLFAILFYTCKVADKELAEFVHIYKSEV